MRIAELGRTGPTLVALSLASLGLLFVPGSNTTDEPVEPVKVERTPEPRSCFRPPPAPCPTAVRAQAGLDQSANIACVQANVGESAWFVFGHYKTTEAWERIGVVSSDGARVLVP